MRRGSPPVGRRSPPMVRRRPSHVWGGSPVLGGRTSVVGARALRLDSAAPVLLVSPEALRSARYDPVVHLGVGPRGGQRGFVWVGRIAGVHSGVQVPGRLGGGRMCRVGRWGATMRGRGCARCRVLLPRHLPGPILVVLLLSRLARQAGPAPATAPHLLKHRSLVLRWIGCRYWRVNTLKRI